MASSPKIHDPAAEALQAIEEALNLRAGLGDPFAIEGAGAEPARDLDKVYVPGDHSGPTDYRRKTGGAPRLPSTSEEPLFGPPRQDVPASAGEAAPGQSGRGAFPANDDRHSAGEMLRAYQGRSNRAPTIIAALCSALWILLTTGFVVANRESLFGAANGSVLPTAALYLLTIAGPVVFFFVTAMMIRRGQEMRVTARSMTQVAMRLAEPETIATEQMVTLSQAIRREVASMGDGIERALARAGELETLVRSEVSNLERSFSDNERRVRALIDELAGERESILANADRVRGAISIAHDGVTRDIETASARFSDSVGEAAGRVTASVNAKGDEIRMALSRGRDDLAEHLSSHGNELASRLSQTGSEAAANLTEASTGIAQTLDQRLAELEGRLTNARELLSADLGMRGDALAERLDAAASRIAETISARGESVAARLSETHDRLHEVVAVKGGALADSIAETSARFGNLIAERTDMARASLDQSSRGIIGSFEDGHARLQAEFERHGAELQRSFAAAAQSTTDDALQPIGSAARRDSAASLAQMIAALNSHSEHVHGHLDLASQDMVAAFTGRTEALSDQLAAAVHGTFAALDDHSTLMSERLETSSEQAATDFAGRSEALHARLAAMFEETLAALTDRSDHVAGRLETSVDQSVAALAEYAEGLQQRLSATLGALSRHAADISERLGAAGDQTLGAFTAQTEALHERMEETISGLDEHSRSISRRLAESGRQSAGALASQTEALQGSHQCRGPRPQRAFRPR